MKKAKSSSMPAQVAVEAQDELLARGWSTSAGVGRAESTKASAHRPMYRRATSGRFRTRLHDSAASAQGTFADSMRMTAQGRMAPVGDRPKPVSRARSWAPQ